MDREKDLEELVESYKEEKPALTELERARSEQAIWSLRLEIEGRGLSKKGGGERRDWFYAKVGDGGPSQYEHRATLLNCGAWTEDLFSRVDKGTLTLSGAIIMSRKAKTLAKIKNITNAEALKKVLNGYDGTNSTVATSGVDTPAPPSGSAGGSREFMSRIEMMGREYVHATLDGKGIDEYHVKKLANDFVGSMREVVIELRRGVDKLKKRAKQDNLLKVGRGRFNWALEVLGMKGTFGKKVDLKKANNLRRQRARDLHPDRNKSPGAVEEYNNVNTAFDLLEMYNEQLEGKE